MTRTIGIDLGSRRTKAVVLENGIVTERGMFNSWALDHQAISEWVRRHDQIDATGSTGYSRRLAEKEFGARPITEIRAFALGSSLLAPGTRTVIDIGGQDAKVIRVEEGGQAADFEMNDRCAAGTGKFFELAARTLGLPLEEMPTAALAVPDDEHITISSTCAVFAESEIIGRLAEGTTPAAIARAIYHSVAERLFAMVQRTGFEPPVILVGGGANACLARILSHMLETDVATPADGSFFGAVGVALYAGKEAQHS